MPSSAAKMTVKKVLMPETKAVNWGELSLLYCASTMHTAKFWPQANQGYAGYNES